MKRATLSFRLLPWLAVLWLCVSACSPTTLAIRASADILDHGFASMEEEEDVTLAEQATAANLKMVEALIRADPGNVRFLTQAAKGFTSYALGFIEDADPGRALHLYRRARDYGFVVLDRKHGFGAARRGPVDGLGPVLARMGEDDVPALFWTAMAWGNWANLNRTDPGAIADVPRVQAVMERARALDPAFYFHGADLFLGVLKASRSKMLGGDPEGAKVHFERNLAATGRVFLMTQVFYARYYARQVQDRPLFQSLLEEVLDADPAALPAARLSNELAKRKAARLLDQIDDRFI